MENKRVIIVCGKICSGKNTFCDTLFEHEHIAVSDIVKRMTGVQSRSKLQETAELDNLIAAELISLIYTYDKVVINGIRQLSILQFLQRDLSEDDIELVWLEVPDEELKRRYLTRFDSKDENNSFEAAIERDDKLGLIQLEQYLKSNHKTVIINDSRSRSTANSLGA